MAILQDVSKLSLQAQIDKLTAENARLKASRTPTPSIKIHALGTSKTDAKGVVHECKGNLSVYGLGRFPVTLYGPQWLKLLDMAEDIRQAVEDGMEEGTLSKSRDD